MRRPTCRNCGRPIYKAHQDYSADTWYHVETNDRRCHVHPVAEPKWWRFR